MSAERLTYLDSSAIVRLVEVAPESTALRHYLRQRRPYVSSALARAEVARALLPRGVDAVRRGQDVLSRIDLVRVNDRVLNLAGALPPSTLRSLDAIHLATARLLGASLARVVTYDARLATAARTMGFTVSTPGLLPAGSR
jgi:predicted nucleic acid-binding protein